MGIFKQPSQARAIDARNVLWGENRRRGLASVKKKTILGLSWKRLVLLLLEKVAKNVSIILYLL